MIFDIPTRTTLTAAQRRVLTQMRDKEYPDNEIVCSGVECWIGTERTSWKLVRSLLCMVAVSDASDEGGGAHRYTINETGKHILNDESNIQAVAAAMLKGGAWTWDGDKLVLMDAKPDGDNDKENS